MSGGLFDKTALSGSSASITSWQQGRQLVAVVDTNNNPVLLGFVGPGHATLSAASTSAVLTYFAAAGYAAPNETQETLLETIERDPDLGRVTADVSAQVLAAGNLSSSSAAFRVSTQTVAESLLGGTNAVTAQKRALPPAVAINPADTAKSGVTVQYGAGTNQIFASNTFRRRVLLFVDQVSTIDNNGVTSPAPLALQEQELAPANGQISALDLLGSLGFTAQQTLTQTISLPTVPATLSEVDYKVTVAGGGANVGEVSTLNTKEQADLTAFLQKSFVKDFFLPIFNRVMVSNTVTQTSLSDKLTYYSLLEAAVDSNAASAEQFVTNTFPNAVSQMQQGDYRGANQAILTALANPAKQTQMASFYSSLLATANLPGLTSNSNRVSFVLAWLGKAIVAPQTGSFVFPQFTSYDQSDRIDSWQVAANRYKVTLTPAAATVDSNTPSNKSVTLTANVSLPNGIPNGSTLVYSWITTGKHGDLIVGSQNGVNFQNTAYNDSIYDATVGLAASQGDDTVTVEVGLKDSHGVITPIGATVSTVTVIAKSDITLVPAVVSIQPGQTTGQIVASTNSPQNFANGKAALQWSCPNKLGTLNAPSSATTQTTVTYTAGQNQGTETITCDYLYNGTKLSTSTMTVLIQKQPTIGFGYFSIRGHDFVVPPGIPYSTAGGYFCVPKISGVKQYQVHCYNFFDPYAYGNHYDFTLGPNGEGADPDVTADGHQLNTVGAGGVFYKDGPGESTSAYGKAIKDVQANLAGRLGGIIVQVTMTY